MSSKRACAAIPTNGARSSRVSRSRRNRIFLHCSNAIAVLGTIARDAHFKELIPISSRAHAMSTAAAEATHDHLDLADMRRRIKAIFIGSVGNLVEWYDFYAYAAFALYFAGAFFPNSDPVVQQLNAALLFAAGFLVRPLGGWLFGHLADQHGRRGALMLSVALMCFGSLMIAVTPTYQSIGIAAPIILAIARIVQGLSLGGEYGTSATYLTEMADQRHRGFYSSFQYVTLIGGQITALLVLLLLQNIFLST